MSQQAYQIEQDRRVLVARPTRGECLGADIAQLVIELSEKIDSGIADSVVIELSNVEHMDSACLGKLLVLRAKAGSAGGSVALAKCQPNVAFLFEMTKLDKALGLFDTTEAAVAELRDRRTRKANAPDRTAHERVDSTRPRHRYTPLLNALLRAHRRRFAHVSRPHQPPRDQPFGL